MRSKGDRACECAIKVTTKMFTLAPIYFYKDALGFALFFASMLLGQARDKTWDDNTVRVVGHK